MLKGKNLARDIIVLFSLLFLIKFYEDYRSLPLRNRTPKKHAKYVASRIMNHTLWYLSFGTKQLQKKVHETFPNNPIEEGSNVGTLLAQLSTAYEYIKQDFDISENSHNKLIAAVKGTESYVSHIHDHYGPQEGTNGTVVKKREYDRKILKAAQKTSIVLTDIANELNVQDKQCPIFESLEEALDYNEMILKTLAS